MVCPQCSYTNSDTSLRCEKCATPLPLDSQTLATSVQGWSVPAAPGSGVVISAESAVQLSPGPILGNRYEMVRLLGQGGMGAGNRAEDRELERKAALTEIRAAMAR